MSTGSCMLEHRVEPVRSDSGRRNSHPTGRSSSAKTAGSHSGAVARSNDRFAAPYRRSHRRISCCHQEPGRLWLRTTWKPARSGSGAENLQHEQVCSSAGRPDIVPAGRGDLAKANTRVARRRRCASGHRPERSGQDGGLRSMVPVRSPWPGTSSSAILLGAIRAGRQHGAADHRRPQHGVGDGGCIRRDIHLVRVGQKYNCGDGLSTAV